MALHYLFKIVCPSDENPDYSYLCSICPYAETFRTNFRDKSVIIVMLRVVNSA